MTLSKTERLILANQYRILELIDPDNAKYHERSREAVESGYESAINQLFDPIFDGLSYSECGFVSNVMAMYDALQRAQKDIGDESVLANSDVQFRGFDGNHETEYMAYARFIVEHEDRFTYLEPVGGRFNSHMPMVSRYRAMMREWKKFDESYELTLDQARQVLAAK